MTVTWTAVGGVGPADATVTARITGAEARLAVDTDPALGSPTYTDLVTPNAGSVVHMTAQSLNVDTTYYFGVEEDGILDTDYQGRFVTHPGGPGAAFGFRIGFSSCAGLEPLEPGVGTVYDSTRISNYAGHNVIRQQAIDQGWLAFCHLGDMHYYNPGQLIGSAVADYRKSWDDVMLQPNQARLLREVALVYPWDDHDFGPNDSDTTAPGRNNAQQVYREYFPHYPLPAEPEGGGNHPIFHAFVLGRVQFIVSDCRSSRTSNDEPDDENKTMLGLQQKNWMRGVLEESESEFLVWLTPSPWLQGDHGTDNWSNFTTEAAELVDMFTETGWIDRMVAVTGDTHHMGIDDGSTGVTPGGIPLFVFGPIDSRVNSGSGVGYSEGSVGHADRAQYGMFDIADDGTEIVLTGIGYINGAEWARHTITVLTVEGGEAEPEPEPEPIRRRVATAVARLDIDWYSCDLVSGRVVTQIPQVNGKPKRVIGQAESVNLTVPIPQSGPGAFPIDRAMQATVPGTTMIVPVINAVPAAGFIVMDRVTQSSPTIDLACVSIEGYLDRRYVGDHEWKGEDENSVIATGLLQDAQNEGINLILDTPRTGRNRDRTYAHDADATVLARRQELADVENGPEFTIDLDWSDDTETVVDKVVRSRNRIGTLSDKPDAMFDTMGSSQATYKLTESYSDGRGANHVIAVGSGQGEDRPESDPVNEVLSGWPRYEARIQPSTSISDVDTLNEHARSELELRKYGSRVWEITVRWGTYPQMFLDWDIGDDVAWLVTGAAHPSGIRARGRIIGWEVDLQGGTVKVILWDPFGR